MQNLTLSYRKISELAGNPQNARTHSKRQIAQIGASIDAFGFTNPLLVDERGVLIAGHGRLEAARAKGLEQVPVIVLDHLSEAGKRALMLADNKIALNAGWNMEILALELADLVSMELDFDIEVTGFESPEIEIVLGDAAAGKADAQETAPIPGSDLPTIAHRGDLWFLGRHRLLCGDARSSEDITRLMAECRADMIFTDPPYNVKISGHVSGNGKIRHREFAEASGEMSSPEFARFLTEALSNASGTCRDGAVSFVCMDWRHMREVQEAGARAFDEMLNLCVWAKTNGGMGSLYRSQHELVFVYRKGKRQHRNNIQLGRFGRNRTNVWSYPGVNVFRESRMEELMAHPTAKPVAMIRDALLDVTKRGEVVLDPFIGGGATLIAAEQSGRTAYGMDIDPAYVDVTLMRWRKETGEEPRRVRDNRSLSSLEAERMEGRD